MITKDQRMDFLETLSKELDHLKVKHGLDDKTAGFIKSDVLNYVDMGILRPLL